MMIAFVKKIFFKFFSIALWMVFIIGLAMIFSILYLSETRFDVPHFVTKHVTILEANNLNYPALFEEKLIAVTGVVHTADMIENVEFTKSQNLIALETIVSTYHLTGGRRKVWRWSGNKISWDRVSRAYMEKYQFSPQEIFEFFNTELFMEQDKLVHKIVHDFDQQYIFISRKNDSTPDNPKSGDKRIIVKAIKSGTKATILGTLHENMFVAYPFPFTKKEVPLFVKMIDKMLNVLLSSHFAQKLYLEKSPDIFYLARGNYKELMNGLHALHDNKIKEIQHIAFIALLFVFMIPLYACIKFFRRKYGLFTGYIHSSLKNRAKDFTAFMSVVACLFLSSYIVLSIFLFLTYFMTQMS